MARVATGTKAAKSGPMPGRKDLNKNGAKEPQDVDRLVGSRVRAYASRPAAVARRRPYETGLGGVLRGHCRLGAAVLNRATVVLCSVPVRNGKQMLLPEARLGGHGWVSQAAGHRRR